MGCLRVLGNTCCSRPHCERLHAFGCEISPKIGLLLLASEIVPCVGKHPTAMSVWCMGLSDRCWLPAGALRCKL